MPSDIFLHQLRAFALVIMYHPCSGCRDGSIHHHDVRKPEHIVAMSKYHHLEVCGLQWSTDGSRLASGGNDNMVCIWNASDPSKPSKLLRGHQAAVKVSSIVMRS